MDVLENGNSLLLLFGKVSELRVFLGAAGRLVKVVALEDDGLVLDVGHHDV